MINAGRTELLESIDAVAGMMADWSLEIAEWCLLDGPAIQLHNPYFDSSTWRDHLNLYVKETSLKWNTEELELTVPPVGSAELHKLIELARSGIHVHLVPACRYYRAGFERKSVYLPSRRPIEAATVRGCSQVWSYKSVELIERQNDFEGDRERIVEERLVRLEAALSITRETDVRERLLILRQGYEALRDHQISDADALFRRAAGMSWVRSNKVTESC